MRRIYFVCLILGLTSCHSSDSDQILRTPTLSDQKIKQHGCLNLALVKEELNQEATSQETTIFFKPDRLLPEKSQQFHSLSIFDQRHIKTSDIIDFYKIEQSDCKTVIIQTRHQDLIHYNIINSTPNSITIKASQSSNKIGIYALVLTRISDTQMILEKSYLNFNAHCRTLKKYRSIVTTYYSWSTTTPPDEVIIPEFQNLYLAALENYRLYGHASCKN